MIMVSVDPGTIHCGVVIWELDDITLNIINTQNFTIEIDPNLILEERLWMLYDIFFNIFTETNTLHLAHESAFLNRFRPMAYGPIYTSINIIRKSFYDYSFNFKRAFAYPPKLVKATIVKGTANKNDMLLAVRTIKELQPFILGNETEHEIDALAIGYTHLLNLRNMNELMLL